MPLLQGRRSRRRCDLETLCVLQTISSPGQCLKPWLFDRSTVDDARAERAVGHAVERIAHLFEQIRPVFDFNEFF